MCNMRLTILLGTFCLVLFSMPGLAAESPKKEHSTYDQSMDFSPLSPMFRIYAIQYYRHLTPRDEVVLGAAYTNLQWDFGETNAATLIVGYRRYLWKKLHIEYQLWPDYDWFYEKQEERYYEGFDLWNEFRLGYQVDFSLGNLPCFINFQWPFGFGLYAANKPDSFRQHEEENPYFYFPPMFFLGIRFF
ncbi:MAG: hypothetical protein K9N46_11440 [Candidatus Marinimicrobia bacterium]|nr:hypothetical protein [Candidatus Neomarinimicrobiota bacterium]MCF7827426.1 hypothetical protein [Candidatus Neomarinimicrobiota bacterium]MCF7881341.1 hypothetical protein [Candidatus Neomarinimicrobiota bacterium]